MAKVKCGNCGAYVELPEHSTMCFGETISKESNGNYTLKMEKENKIMMKASERLAAMKVAGIDTTGYFAFGDTLVKMENGVPVEVKDEFEKIKSSIVNDGKVFNRVLDGRWIMAQMFHMLYSNNGRYDKDAYTKNLNRRGYFYQWEFLTKYNRNKHKLEGELIRIAKREEQGDRLVEKARWFNKSLIGCMILDYIEKLETELQKYERRNCKGIEYIRLGNRYEHITKKPHGDIFVSDLRKIKSYYIGYYNRVWNARNYRELAMICEAFKKNMIKIDSRISMCPEFVDAYKGNGAYYTIKNMVEFHNVIIPGCDTKEESLDFLEERTCDSSGWVLLGWLKDIIERTEFEFKY